MRAPAGSRCTSAPFRREERMDSQELLKFAMENGMLDMAQVQIQYTMKKRMHILEQHNYEIWQGSDGKWRTYLRETEGKRRMVKRNTKEAVEDAVIQFYESRNRKKDTVTFRDAYFKWRSVQDEMVGDNTVAKYMSDYSRYFENAEFSQKDICWITEEDVKLFICRTTKEQQLCKKACKTLFGYMRRTFESAVINKVISESPMMGLAAKDFYKYCTEKKKAAAARLISDGDMEKLYERFREDYRKKPEYIPTYAVEFASLTGMRVGEIAALTWDCIKDSYIVVKQSEKYNRRTKEYYIDATKNERDRVFPLTEKIKELLNRVKKAEIQNGFICEWVFANEDGRLNAPVISSCAKNKCRQLGINEKGIHAYRRTVNSKMRCAGVPATVAAALLGHSEAVNNKYYTFDVTDMDEKMRIIESVNRKMPIAN